MSLAGQDKAAKHEEKCGLASLIALSLAYQILELIPTLPLLCVCEYIFLSVWVNIRRHIYVPLFSPIFFNSTLKTQSISSLKKFEISSKNNFTAYEKSQKRHTFFNSYAHKTGKLKFTLETRK
jgi:hypothetical protein